MSPGRRHRNEVAAVAEAFASAPFVANGWDAALRGMASATGCSRGQLLAMGDRHLAFNWCTDTDEDYIRDFLAIEGHRADVNYRIAASGQPFELVHEDHYDRVRAANTNEAYLDHALRFDGEYGAQMALVDRPGSFFGIAGLRGDGRTTGRQREALVAIAPHVLSAIRRQRAIEHQGSDMLRGSLEAMRVAAVLLDARGNVCGRTPAVEAVLSGGAVRIARERLHAARATTDRALQAMIARALGRGAAQNDTDLWVDSAAGPMLVEVFSLPRLDWALGYAPAVSVTFRMPLRATDHAARLAGVLGLTAAEGEIVALLASGLSRGAIAAARDTSPATVATQLRTIFRKCDVNRESALVARAQSIIGARL